MKPLLHCAVLLVLFISCKNQNDKNYATNVTAENYCRYVNPMVGTSTMGHTFPGATAPFGMVQLGPQTDMQPYFNPDGSYNKKTYEYCAGYQYRDTTIIGFAHTNFSGTGHSGLGDFLVMPTTGDLVLRIACCIISQIIILNHFIHDTSFRDTQIKQLGFVYFRLFL